MTDRSFSERKEPARRGRLDFRGGWCSRGGQPPRLSGGAKRRIEIADLGVLPPSQQSPHVDYLSQVIRVVIGNQ